MSAAYVEPMTIDGRPVERVTSRHAGCEWRNCINCDLAVDVTCDPTVTTGVCEAVSDERVTSHIGACPARGAVS